MQDTSGHRAGMLRGGAGLASRAIVQALLLGVTIIATRTLTIADFGAYALGSLLLVLGRQALHVGPYEYLLKLRGDQEEVTPSACLAANLIVAGVLASVLLAVRMAGTALFETAEVGHVLGLLIPSLWLAAVAAWQEAMLLQAGRVRRYYGTTLAADTAGALAAVVLLTRGYGIVAMVAQTYVRLTVVLALHALATRPRLGRPRGIRLVLRWSRTRYAAVLLNFTTSSGADLLLGLLLSPTATGLYRAAGRIVAALTDLFTQPLQKIAQTNLSAQAARQTAVGLAWLKMLSGAGAVAWAGLLTLAVVARDLVPLALGEKWAEAVPIVVVFCVAKGFAVLDAVTTALLICHDRQKAMLGVQMAAAGAIMVLGYLTAPFGPLAVAAAVGAICAAMSSAYAAIAMRLSHADTAALHDLVRTAAPPVIGAGLGLALIRTTAPHLQGLAGVAGCAVAAGLGFLAGAYAVRRRLVAALGALGPAMGVDGPVVRSAAPGR